jgi:hypothetical protein
MKKKILFAVLLFISCAAHATHNRAGEITYKHITGYTYKITVTTYTKESSHPADKCSLTIRFGDSDTAIFNRTNGLKGTLCGGTIPEGEFLGNDIKKNIYEGFHTYPGPNTYTITMEDPNRNAGICNFGGAPGDQLSFFLKTVLVINPLLPFNNSMDFLNPPVDNGCQGQCFYHNPGAYDMDGDSLYYSLVPCYAYGKPIPTYQFPAGVTAESIDHLTGEFTWCVPTVSCQYNIAILVEEWKYLAGKRYFIGSTLRDMQIDISPCTNHSPVMKKNPDSFVEIGTTFHYQTSVSDPDLDKLTLTARGGPFLLTPAATLTTTDAVSNVTGDIDWKPDCKEIQLLPYQVTFKVADNHTTQQLANFEVLNIRVIAPGVTALTVQPFVRIMDLSWNEIICSDTAGPAALMGYDIYRKMNCDSWVHQPGETGIPASAGYTWIGSTDAMTTKFTDSENGLGLTIGKEYTYIIVAHYKNGSLSYASTGACALITGIHEVNNDIALTIAPNPNNGTFTLVSEFYANSIITVSIKNSLGQVVYSSDGTMTKEGQTIDANLEPGIYMIQISNEKNTSVKRMVINK